MKLKLIRIVLVGTSHPGNIGSAARAMKTMGLSDLCLVNPRHFPSATANELAAGADDVLENATVVHHLEDALKDCHQVFATSARARDLGLVGLTAKECARLIVAQERHAQIAIVFGREHAGLTNEELLRCHYHIHIPSDSNFSSLNLAQSVQIIAYELRMQHLQPEAHVQNKPPSLATHHEIELFYKQLNQVLIDIDFLNPNNPNRILQRLRRLFNRSGLETTEINILRGILAHIQLKCGHLRS